MGVEPGIYYSDAGDYFFEVVAPEDIPYLKESTMECDICNHQLDEHAENRPFACEIEGCSCDGYDGPWTEIEQLER